MTTTAACSLEHFNELLSEVPNVPYIVFPMRLMDILYTDRRLKDQDRTLWYFLFKETYFDKAKREIRISLSSLSKLSHHCKNTVIESLKRLEEAGYIIRSRSSDRYHDGDLIEVRFPNSVDLSKPNENRARTSNIESSEHIPHSKSVGSKNEPMLVHEMNRYRFKLCTASLNNNKYINNKTNNKEEVESKGREIESVPSRSQHPVVVFKDFKSTKLGKTPMNPIQTQATVLHTLPSELLEEERDLKQTLEALEEQLSNENTYFTHLMRHMQSALLQKDETLYSSLLAEKRQQETKLSSLELLMTQKERRLEQIKKEKESLVSAQKRVDEQLEKSLERVLTPIQQMRIKSAL